jgi:hypothetical protein
MMKSAVVTWPATWRPAHRRSVSDAADAYLMRPRRHGADAEHARIVRDGAEAASRQDDGSTRYGLAVGLIGDASCQTTLPRRARLGARGGGDNDRPKNCRGE